MKNVLITGSNGFIGKNLIVALKRLGKHNIIEFDIENSFEDLITFCSKADAVIHLAGVNRPEKDEEYEQGNVAFTQDLLRIINNAGSCPVIIYSSSIQAELDNPYGKSKKKAEDILKKWANEQSGTVLIYRLPNVFGKWCRPNYNSAVATFCYNLAHDLDIQINDPGRILELVYIDDVVEEFIDVLGRKFPEGIYYREVKPVFKINIVELVNLLKEFRESRKTLRLPNFADSFIKRLYATYVSYLPENEFAYSVSIKSDKRGDLAELMKSLNFGQIFISRTRPGEIRGNHYHDSKVEKFIVIDGEAIISFRHIIRNEIIEYQVSGKDFKIVDIPPGYTHSIKNIGQQDLIVLFWADEIFDPERTDTYYLEVRNEKD